MKEPKNAWSNIQKYLRLLIYWTKMLCNRSYYHVPQKIGKAFRPDELNGYFNDMIAKTDWKGHVDTKGIPVIQLLNGSKCYFPITICQKAIGHYDKYMLNKNNRDFDEFLKISQWLLKKQDQKGGWEIESIMNLNGPSIYSAMVQGEAISVLVRAWKHTKKDQYMNAAKKAYVLMMRPVQEGGTVNYCGDNIFMEEYPTKDKNTVLNGWIFALFGIYDLFLATGEEAYKKMFYHSLYTLINNLYVYDAGYWSFYDEQKTLASPFYHDLHISQLEALYAVSGENAVEEITNKWKTYKRNIIKRSNAFISKAFQKILKPPKIIIVK